MPNHVDQDLWVSGEVTELNKFMEFAKEGECEDENLLSTDKFIPYPQEYKDMDVKAAELRKLAALKREQGNEDWWKDLSDIRDGFNSGGYQWCIDNWGTKWGIYDCVRSIPTTFGSRKKGQVFYAFQSAWSPACKIIDAMSKKFPTLTFKLKYYEGGMGFQGTYIVSGGVEKKNESKKYNGRRGG
jgi:hypothetical protein